GTAASIRSPGAVTRLEFKDKFFMTHFADLESLRTTCLDLPPGNDQAAAAVVARQAELTKPPGSLGRLEEMAAWLARWQGQAMPVLDNVALLVFAGNQGVTAQ